MLIVRLQIDFHEVLLFVSVIECMAFPVNFVAVCFCESVEFK